MAIASGVICAWPSTVASVPSGWSRETGLDAKYIRGSAAGADADLVTAFGNATHTHTENTGGGTSHTPIQDTHVHTFSSGTPSASVRRTATVADATASSSTHTHASKNSNSATATNNSATATLTAYTNELQYAEVIWIKSDGTPTGFPNGSYIYFATDIFPSGWTRVNGNGYLKGAAAAGDGGGTGGSNTHSHSESGSHTHTQNSHTHAAVQSSNSSPNTTPNFGDGAGTDSSTGHQHTITFSTDTATNNSVSVTTDSVSIEPPFLKLNTLLNGTGGQDLPGQAIALWGSTNASIPAGWSRYSAMDTLFPKSANSDGESAHDAGGTSAGHAHSATCQVTSVAHTHTPTAGGSGNGVCDSVIIRSGGVLDAINTHTHTWTINNATITHQATTVTFSTSSADAHIPAYAKVIFIQWGAFGGQRQLYPYWYFV